MSDIRISELPPLSVLASVNDADVYPVVNNNVTQKIRFDTLYTKISSVILTEVVFNSKFNTLQTIVSANSGNWNSTYTTVQGNSSTWGATTVNILTALSLFREISSSSSPNTSNWPAHGLSAFSLSASNVDFVINPKGTGAIIAQIPTGTSAGGGKRGEYAVDLQRIRNNSLQVASGNYSVIVGGENNRVTNLYSSVVGGNSNAIYNTYSHIGGGSGNEIFNSYSAIGGGFDNETTNDYTTIGGGYSNQAVTNFATVAGGSLNKASGQYSFVGGGQSLSAAGSFSTAVGGHTLSASGDYSAIVGGLQNKANSDYSFIGGGVSNIASGGYSSILGGQSNNTNNKENAHIIGSNITAPLSNYTYVNNISTTGNVASNTAVITSLTSTNTNLTNLTATNSIVTNLTATSTTSTTISAATYQGAQAIKAWVNFDGTGSIGSNATINASYNINFVRKVNVGLYTVVFANSSIFNNQYYIMSGSGSGNLLLTPVLSADSRTSTPSLKTSLSCMVAILTGSAVTTNRADSKEVGLMFIGS